VDDGNVDIAEWIILMLVVMVMTVVMVMAVDGIKPKGRCGRRSLPLA
jgi:hypothetical protein